MELFQQRAAILDNREHLEEVHCVITMRRFPAQKVSLYEVEASRLGVGVPSTRPFDLLRAYLHASHTTTKT
jgi:hypothetical protein